MNQKKIYSINSDGRSSGSSTDFTFVLKNHPPNNQFNKISLLSCLLSKTYNTIDDENNKIILNETDGGGIGPLTVTLPTGLYSKAFMENELKKALDKASTLGGNALTYTVTHTALTNALTVKVSSGSFNLRPQSQSLSDITGLDFDLNLSTFDTLVFPTMINLQRYSELQIHCNLASNFNNDILFSVFPSSQPLGDIIYTANDPLATCVDLTNNSTNLVHITLTDLNGKVININNQDVKLTVLMWSE